MRLASRLATTGITAAIAVGSLLTTSSQAAPERTSAQPAAITAQSSGTYWCTKGIPDCRQQRNYYLYLGCSASPIRGTWYTGWYVFDWRC